MMMTNEDEEEENLSCIKCDTRVTKEMKCCPKCGNEFSE